MLRTITLVSLSALATLSIACAGQGSAVSPSALTPASSSTSTALAQGATISGVVSGLATSSTSSSSGALASHTRATTTIIVTVVGTSASAPVDGNGAFTITGVPPVDVVLQFDGPTTHASVPLGVVTANDHVEISVTLNTSTATVDTQQKTAADNTADATGEIVGIDYSGRRMKVGSTYVEVPTDATIRRDDAPTRFEDLKQGDRARVRGVMNNSLLRASIVEAKAGSTTPAPEPPPPTPSPSTSVTVTGTIEGVSGTCPNLYMKISGTYVKTNSATVFGGKVCGEIKAGDIGGVLGTRQSDGIVLAEKTSIASPKPAPEPTPTPTPTPQPDGTVVIGVVSGLQGTCPSLTFTVGTTTVKSNASTQFGGKGCGDLKNGDNGGAKVAPQSDGSLLATYTSFAH